MIKITSNKMAENNNSKNKKSLFGTDGVRGRVGEYPLDNHSLSRLGFAFGTWLKEKKCKIVIGKDTRASGPEIEKQLAIGIHRAAPEVEIHSCGILPTPGLAMITRKSEFQYGIMITASHNPFTDNGIKFFDANGEKLSEAIETQLEHIFFENQLESLSEELLPDITTLHPEIYYDFLQLHLRGLEDSPMKLVVDCAEGASYQVATKVFESLPQWDVTIIHNEPDGQNINRGCGSTNTEDLAAVVASQEAQLGIAFDGDADRVLFVDAEGRLLDGDHVLYLLALYLADTDDAFKQNKVVVGTTMSNLGLEKALQSKGIGFERSDVGDKHVYESLKTLNASLGGEQSGHTILRHLQTTGDGILTAVYFLKALNALGIEVGDVYTMWQRFPQDLRNIEVREKPDLAEWTKLQEMKQEFDVKHGHNSRLVIRYSGTEPKLRLMIESADQDVINKEIDRFQQYIRSEIGKESQW